MHVFFLSSIQSNQVEVPEYWPPITMHDGIYGNGLSNRDSDKLGS